LMATRSLMEGPGFAMNKPPKGITITAGTAS
jgi:hypothetical protein